MTFIDRMDARGAKNKMCWVRLLEELLLVLLLQLFFVCLYIVDFIFVYFLFPTDKRGEQHRAKARQKLTRLQGTKNANRRKPEQTGSGIFLPIS